MTTIRYTQQKWHPLMPFENNGNLQKWHMTNSLLEIDKFDTQRKWWLKKMAHLAKKCPEVICQGLSWMIFKRKFLNLLHDSNSCSWNFKVCFFTPEWYSYCSPESNCRGRFYYHGVSSTSESQKCSSEMPFLWDAIYVGCHFCEVIFLIRGVPFL